jgi:hypothetical protein
MFPSVLKNYPLKLFQYTKHETKESNIVCVCVCVFCRGGDQTLATCLKNKKLLVCYNRDILSMSVALEVQFCIVTQLLTTRHHHVCHIQKCFTLNRSVEWYLTMRHFHFDQGNKL